MFSYILLALSVYFSIEAAAGLSPSVPCVPESFHKDYQGSKLLNIWENYRGYAVPRTIIVSRGIFNLVPQDVANPLYIRSAFSNKFILDYISSDHFDCEKFKPDATVTLKTLSGEFWEIVNGTKGILSVNGVPVIVPPKRLSDGNICVLEILDVLFGQRQKTDVAFKEYLRNNPPSTSFLGR